MFNPLKNSMMRSHVPKAQYLTKALQFEANALSVFIQIIMIFFLIYGLLLICFSETYTSKDILIILSTFLFSLFSLLCLRCLKRQISRGYRKRGIYLIRNIYTTVLMLYVYTIVTNYFKMFFLVIYLVVATAGMIYLNPIHYSMFILFWMLLPPFFLKHALYTSSTNHTYFSINTTVTILFALTVNYVYTKDRYRLFELESQLEHERDTDALTNLMNTRHFHTMLQEFTSCTEGMAVAVLVDLDNFKLVNDTFGHNAGDQVLIEVARILQQVFPSEDHAARIGGDEFASFFLVKTVSWDTIEFIARRKVESLLDKVPIVVCKGEEEIQVTFSIGVCVQSMADGSTPTDILSMADAAMYELKSTSKNGGCLCLGDQPLIKIFGHSDHHIGSRLELSEESNPFLPLHNQKNGGIAARREK